MSQSTHLTPEDISKLAQLSRLKLTDEEIVKGTEQLGHILQNFAMIQSIKIDEADRKQGNTKLSNVVRVDEARANRFCLPEQLISNAPESYKGQVKVSAVFS